MTSTIADATEIAKTLYHGVVPEIGFTDTPFWGMLPKNENFFGLNKAFSSRYTKTPGASKTYARSRTRAGASAFGRWTVTRTEDFVTMQIEAQMYEALGNEEGAQTNYVEEESTSAFDHAVQRIERNLFRNAGGAVARISDDGDTAVLTVTDPADLVGLDVGQYVTTSNTDGTSGSDDGFPQEITGIDRVAGTLTTDAASWDVDGGFSDNDYLFVDGDFGLALSGLDAWIPPQNPTSALFYGQDRSIDVQRLGGIRYTAQAGEPDGSIERALVNAGVLAHNLGGRTSHIFMNTLDYGVFLNDLGNRARVHITPGQGIDGKKLEVSYSGIKVQLASGTAVVYPSRHCQRYTAWLLDMKDLQWCGLGKTPRFFDLDGGKWFRMSADDVHGLEAYLYWYGQFVVKSPGCHVRVDLTELFE